MNPEPANPVSTISLFSVNTGVVLDRFYFQLKPRRTG
jgi:hypothetical protein